MGVGANREVVVAILQDVGFGVVGIVAGQVFLVDGNGIMLGGTGGDHLFVKAAQLHSRLLHLIVDIVLGVGALEVDLHRVLAVHITGVGYIHPNLEGVALVLHREVGILEGGVAQAIAEGEGHIGGIIIVTGVAAVQHIVLIAGLIITVAHIDAFLIDHIVLVALDNAGVGVVLRGGHIIVGAVCIVEGAEVLHGRGRMVVLEEGIHDAAGGVDVAGQDVSHAVDAGHAHVTDPQCRVNAVAVQKVQLQRVGGIEQHNDLFEHALLLELLQVGEHVDFFLAELQVVTVGHVGLQLRQAAGQVGALAAGAGQHHQGHIAVFRPGILQVLGILGPGHLIDAVLGLVAAGGVGVDAGITTVRVKVPLGRVDGALTESVLQGLLQGDGILGGNLAGTGAAVHQVVAGLGEGGELGAFRQGQGVVVVQQQSRALRLDAFAEFLFKGDKVLLVVVIAGEVHGRFRVGDDLLRLGVQCHADDGGKSVCDRDRHNAYRQQNGCDRCQDDPAFACFLFHV